jgi:hypothetical protein
MSPSPDRFVETLRIEIPRGFAYRLLGLRRGRRLPRASVRAMFDEELAVAHGLVDARAATRLSGGGLPGSGHIEPGVPLAAVVCTIGSALEARVSELADDGQTARAMVLDAIGSAAAEEVADRSNQRVCGWAADTGRVAGRRSSPGYGSWDVTEQRALFGFVEPVDIGVTLNDSCMMVPRKSVSYIVPLVGEASAAAVGRDRHARDDSRCARCSLTDCPYRADPETFHLEA